LKQMRRSIPRPLVPPAMRPFAVALLVACVAITVILGALFAHHARAGTLDTAVDAWIQAGLGGHLRLLNQLAGLGGWIPVGVVAAALLLACLVTRSWRGAVLVAVAVPVAHALTEHVLKPLVGRTLPGGALCFPSGHETHVFTLTAAFAVLLIGPLHPRMPVAIRLLLALAMLTTAGAVAIALVGKGAHYFTDTVGGAAVGTAVVLATTFVLDWLGPVLWWRLRQPDGLPEDGPKLGQPDQPGRRGQDPLRIHRHRDGHIKTSRNSRPPL
jgi:membrane-associated phospholipid phosphatase